MAEKTKTIPVIDDAMLVELFTNSGENLKKTDVALAQQEKALTEQLRRVRAKRSKHALSLDALKYVDYIHNGAALMVRPMVLDLVRFLGGPSSVFSRLSIPRKYEEKKPDTSEVSLVYASVLKEAEKPNLRPLEKAQVIAVSPSALASSVRLTLGNPCFHSLHKAIILGFESGWYVCPLKETNHVIGRLAQKPESEFRRYKTRDGALRAAYDYTTTGQITSRKTIPPELTAVYEKSKARQAEFSEWRRKNRAEQEKKQAEKEKKGEEMVDSLGLFLWPSEDDGRPETLHIWHA